MTNRLKRFLAIFLTIVVILAALAYLITWNSSSMIVSQTPSKELAEKIINIPKNNMSITLTNDELNQLIDLYPIGENSFGDLKVKNIYTKIANDKFDIYLPSNYKGIDILIYTSGKIYLENGKIVYEISSFKIGKLILPKKIVLNTIKNKNIKNVSLKDDKIFIDTSVFQFKMKDIKLKDSTITIRF
ncbi:uncharacterized protein YpmS [Clostridium algifaecis]|uniref:Uncharacterized protein YpmS n=1 Tax=Clostridium algifaecis TaxID=1472040 RepID=A0ABS4KUJ6_9CLOT|nr:hypothetical protein [Clostridium algifaecis]MBP2033734.1 uncharacterized protein YpmS [Clostridium algifaecis]